MLVRVVVMVRIRNMGILMGNMMDILCNKEIGLEIDPKIDPKIDMKNSTHINI